MFHPAHLPAAPSSSHPSLAALSEQHVERAESGGMAAVIAAPGHYSALAGRSTDHQRALLATDPAVFIACMRRSADFIRCALLIPQRGSKHR